MSSCSQPLCDRAMDRLGAPPAVRALIAQRHGEPHRHYHTLRHIETMLHQIPGDHRFARDMLAASLFHDIVYDPARQDNEEQSLALFRSVAGELAPDGPLDADLVAAMILATKSHHFRDEAAHADAAINLLLKADLGILWHPDPQVYAWYAQGVRREYLFVPDGAFRQARTGILTGLRDDLLHSGRLDRDEADRLVRNVAWELG